MRIFVFTILSLSLAVCPEQTWRNPVNCPFTIDLTKVATDPETGVKGVLGWAVVEIGRTAVIDSNYCDPDGDPVTLTVSEPTRHRLAVDPNTGKYSITTVVQAGTDYIVVTATDAPGLHVVPRTRMGTFVIQGAPPNRPPTVGCGGLRR